MVCSEILILICIPFVTNEVECLFIHLLDFWILSFVQYILKSLLIFFSISLRCNWQIKLCIFKIFCSLGFLPWLVVLYAWIVVVVSLSRVWFFVIPWTAACQVSLSFTISWSLLKFMFIESMMLSNHLILHPPLLLLPSIFTSIRVFFWIDGLFLWVCVCVCVQWIANIPHLPINTLKAVFWYVQCNLTSQKFSFWLALRCLA